MRRSASIQKRVAEHLRRQLAAHVAQLPTARVAVALSGGLDSVALLHGLAQLRARAGFELRALHVNHGLHPSAPHWARHCRALGRRWRVPVRVLEARIARARGVSLEAAARDARYALLAAALRPREILMTAQHDDDQLETMLLQLMRGTGLAGLAAMPESAPFGAGSLLVRPFLGLQRAHLRAYCRAHGLAWVEDESNVDERFDRNYLRARVLPALRARWPAAAVVAARSARHLGSADALLREYALCELQGAAEGRRLQISALKVKSAARQRLLLRTWIESCNLPLPDERHLERVRVEAVAARPDAQPLVQWRGAQIRRFRDWLCAMEPLEPVPQPLEWTKPLGRAAELELGPGVGRLAFLPDEHGPFTARQIAGGLSVRFRVGGETLRTRSAGPTRRVKELLRSAAVPPWLRGRIPLIYSGGQLLSVGGRWNLAPRPPSGGRKPHRYRIEWRTSARWFD